jgi:hypothetical protein
LVGDENTKDIELSGISKSLNLLCCYFLEEIMTLILKNIYTLLYEHVVFFRVAFRDTLLGHSCFSPNKALELMCFIQFQSQ